MLVGDDGVGGTSWSGPGAASLSIALAWVSLSCVILSLNGVFGQVCAPSKAVPLIANYVAERDPLVRNNAIECIVAAYQSSGDKVS